MKCVCRRPRISLARFVWDWYYKSRAENYSVLEEENEIVRFCGRMDNSGRIFYLGYGGSENDAIYSEDVDTSVLRTAFEFWVSRLKDGGCEELQWECLRYDSKFHSILLECNAEIVGSRNVMRINFNYESYDCYFSTLKKHARQNVRTAYNRMARDSRKYDLHVINRDSVALSWKLMWWRCFPVWIKRHAERYGIYGIRHWMAQFARFTLMPRDAGFLSILVIDGKIAGFMQGFRNRGGEEIWATRLAIDSTFLFYSPGMILVNETIRYLYSQTNIRCLNLGRGSEKYKYDMGAIECKAIDYKLRLRS